MQTARSTTLYERLINALQQGVTAKSFAAIVAKEQLKHETREQRKMALKVFQVALIRSYRHDLLLEAMSKEIILPTDMEEENALRCALLNDYEDGAAVMAVVERYRKEEPYELSISTLGAFFRWHYFGKDEKAMAEVLSVIPATTWQVVPKQSLDALDQAIGAGRGMRWKQAVEMVLRLGPSMEERLEGQKRFRYVVSAVEWGTFESVQAMHDMVPLLPDGSGRRGTSADYSSAIEKLMHPRHLKVEVVFDYLMEQGGPDAADKVSPRALLLNVDDRKKIDRLLGCAPHLLEELCKEENSLERLVMRVWSELPHLLKLMVKLVDRDVIAKMLRQSVLVFDERKWQEKRENGWMYKLKALHKRAPECMDGLRWQWLMDAVKERCYYDVEYMLGMCTPEHLVMRDENGDTAYDVAVRDNWMRPKLLARLQKQAKRALA